MRSESKAGPQSFQAEIYQQGLEQGRTRALQGLYRTGRGDEIAWDHILTILLKN